MPTAMIAVTDICVIRFDRLRAVRNVFPGVAQWKYAQMIASTASMIYARRAEALARPFFGSVILVVTRRCRHDTLGRGLIPAELTSHTSVVEDKNAVG